MQHQPELIQPEQLAPRLRWERLFGFLPPWPEPPANQGRKPCDRVALLRAAIYQRLTRRRFLQDLRRHLLENPALLAALGFDPYQEPPSLERFSAFLSDTPHATLEAIRVDLTLQLLAAGVVHGRHLGLDSCPIASWVRENNLKSYMPSARFNNQTPPKGDPDARVGVRIHFASPTKTEVRYFWGYRNHTLADLEAEMPLWEATHPNSVSEIPAAVPLLRTAITRLELHPESITADAEYDAEKILAYIAQEAGAKPYIPRNRRRSHGPGFRDEGDKVFCPANLAMNRHGRMHCRGFTYIQFRCPIHYGPNRDLLLCPANHPKFFSQKGCNYMRRISASIRDQIPYGTEEFKTHYNRRTALERVFSRLLNITIEEPSVRGLPSIRNHCTIAHIAVLLVALAAHRLGRDDRIRFALNFVPDLDAAPAQKSEK